MKLQTIPFQMKSEKIVANTIKITTETNIRKV